MCVNAIVFEICCRPVQQTVFSSLYLISRICMVYSDTPDMSDPLAEFLKEYRDKEHREKKHIHNVCTRGPCVLVDCVYPRTVCASGLCVLVDCVC